MTSRSCVARTRAERPATPRSEAARALGIEVWLLERPVGAGAGTPAGGTDAGGADANAGGADTESGGAGASGADAPGAGVDASSRTQDVSSQHDRQEDQSCTMVHDSVEDVVAAAHAFAALRKT